MIRGRGAPVPHALYLGTCVRPPPPDQGGGGLAHAINAYPIVGNWATSLTTGSVPGLVGSKKHAM